MRFKIPTLAMLGGIVCFLALGYGAMSLSDGVFQWRADARLVPRGQVAIPQRIKESKPLDTDSQAAGLRFATCEKTGIDFRYDHGARGEFHLAETLGGGIGATDFDLDGRTDLVFVDGGDPLSWPSSIFNRIAVYRQTATTQFENVSRPAGCHWTGYGHGCAVGDFNNDGFDDLFFTGYQSTALFLNMGDGTFEEVTKQAGVGSDRWCGTAAFGDLDGDGDLDLYVTAYADVPRSLPTPYCDEGGVRIHCHPHYYPAAMDLVFENRGDGSFADRSVVSGVAQQVQYGLGVIIADLDQDRIPEVFVANDGDRNLLFVPGENWQFSEIGTSAGVAYNGLGQTMGAMGIACADFDGNGQLDLLTTNFVGERNVLFSNQGQRIFIDRSQGSLLDESSRPLVGWAALPLDADCDGISDLFIANGHVTESPFSSYRQRPLLFHGLAGGEWEAITTAGSYFEHNWHGRGAVAVDVTDDQRPDLVVSQIADEGVVLRNESEPLGASITLKLIGVASNRSAATTSVVLDTGKRQSIHQVILSAGYLSGSTAPLHLGIGEATHAQTITIEWQSGLIQTLEGVPGGSSLIVVEGRPHLIDGRFPGNDALSMSE